MTAETFGRQPTRRLTLFRHAHAGFAGGLRRDHERELDAVGQAEATLMGQRWASLGSPPDALLTSTACRAAATARALGLELGFPEARIEARKDLYGAGVDRLLAVVEEADPAHTHLAIVGHNPGISEFARWLCPEFRVGMTTCGVARIAVDVPDWFSLRRRCGRLIEYDCPSLRP